MEDKLKETLKEFESEFTYIDKEGYPRLSNKSPRRLKGWIKSKLIEANTRHVELEVDEYDTTVLLQHEYNRMTGENLEQDIAWEMAQILSKNINQIVRVKT